MNVSVFARQVARRGKISDPEILNGSRYENEFGLFDSVFHEVNTAIAIIGRTNNDDQPIIQDVNHHFELVTGYQLDEIQGYQLYDFLSAEKSADTIQLIEQAMDSRQAAVLFCRWINKQKEIVDINMTIRPFNCDTNENCFICVLRESDPDMKIRDKAAKEIKQNLLSAMHHNFRTPLNGILGFSEMIMSEMLGPIEQDSYKNYAKDIHGAGRELLQLIDNLLELKELETAEFELHEEEFSIHDMIEGCLEKNIPFASKKQINLISDISADLNKLNGDKSRLQQVIHSLLSNALKFTRSGGEISLFSHLDENGNCLISCQDNGCGMPAQQLAKVFCHGTHLFDVYSNPTEGIGFGLTFVKQLVEKHGGSVSIISAPDNGTTVTILLPAERLA